MGRQLPLSYYGDIMSLIRELERMQQNIKELSQAFEALKEASERSSPPEHPNELRDDTTDEVHKRFYRD